MLTWAAAWLIRGLAREMLSAASDRGDEVNITNAGCLFLAAVPGDVLIVALIVWAIVKA